MKKLVSLMLVLLMALSLSATAFAAEINLEGGVLNGTSTGATAVGTIAPLQIKGVVPTVITFAIDPNEAANYTSTPGDAFTAPTFSFQNACNAPLTFSVNNIAAQTDMPAVVLDDKYTDTEWSNLAKTDTLANIAFGFVSEDATQWLAQDNADAWYGLNELAIGDIVGNASANLHLKAKYGMAWGNTVEQTITYDIVYKIAVAE